MSTIKQSVAAKVATSVGATFAFGIATASASAAQLNFNFSTAREGTGSFTLDTSIADTDSSSSAGFFQSAITNFEYSGVGLDSPLNLSTFYDGLATGFTVNAFSEDNLIGSLGNNQLFNLNLTFSGNLADDLPDDPANYFPFSEPFSDGRVGFFGGYGGGFEIARADNDSRITSVSVTAVPEPSSALSGGIALGFGALLKRQYSRKRKTI